jgi:hypothetical protein
MIDFSLLQTPNFAQAALGGWQAGQALAANRRKDAALKMLTARPDDPDAIQSLAAVDPASARTYIDYRSKADANRRATEFRGTLADWMMARKNGGAPQPAALGSPPTSSPTLNADPTAPALGGPTVAGPALGPTTAASAPALGAQPTGQPQGPLAPAPALGDAPSAAPPRNLATAAADGPIPESVAYERMVRADPEGALKAEAAQGKVTKQDVDVWQAVNSASLQLMGGVHDQASYDAAKAQGHLLHQRFGVGQDALALPDKYDPEVVHGLMMQAMDVGRQLAAIRAQHKLDWDIEDDQIDNARADRNVDSEIHHRTAEEGLTARGQNMTDARGRFGIETLSTDRRRGQDIESTDRRRGQDLGAETSRRGQDLGGRRGHGGRAIPTVSTPEQARALPPGTTFRTPDGRVKVR